MANNKDVMTAYEVFNQNGSSVETTKLLTLSLNSTQIVQALWVFDAFVVARLTNKQILFFEKPLILGSAAIALNSTSAPGLSN